MTLEEFSRALAAHALITARPDALETFFAPENAEAVASFIERFARGERIDRPPLRDD